MNGFPYHYAVMALLVLTYGVLAYAGKLPAVSSIQDLSNVINSKGGNILWLGGFTLIFFSAGMGLLYWSMNRVIEGKLTPDNAVLMMGISWITGSAFGGSFSSMLKVMSGENPTPRPGTTVTEKTAVVTSTTEPEVKP